MVGLALACDLQIGPAEYHAALISNHLEVDGTSRRRQLHQHRKKSDSSSPNSSWPMISIAPKSFQNPRSPSATVGLSVPWFSNV
jgi:hypothetical protein